MEREILVLQQMAKNYARGRGMPFVADDFAAYVLSEKSRSERKLKSFKLMLVDFFRVTLGDSRTQKGKARVEAQKNTEYIGEETGVDDEVVDVADPNSINLNSIDLLTFLKPHKIHRACFFLHKKYGLTMSEIAFCFGVTEGRISQLLKQVSDFSKHKKLIPTVIRDLKRAHRKASGPRPKPIEVKEVAGYRVMDIPIKRNGELCKITVCTRS